MIPVAEYIARYRDKEKFIALCKECKNYGTLWSCPPYEADDEPRIEDYKYAYILGTQVFIDAPTRHSADSVERRTELTYEILLEVRKEIDARLIEMEDEFGDALSFYAGSCRQCENNVCTRPEGKPCIKPEKMRTSLEALGFDMGKTTSELLGIEMKWSTDTILPEYFTLVSGLFTTSEHDIKW